MRFNAQTEVTGLYSRASDVTAVNGIAQSDIDQGTVSANVANRGETGFQHGARIGHGFEHKLRGRFPGAVHRFEIMNTIRYVRMAVVRPGSTVMLLRSTTTVFGGIASPLPTFSIFEA